MNGARWIGAAFLLLVMFSSAAEILAGPEIVLGVPTSLMLLEGRESLEAAALAVDEINARGGIEVGRRRMPLRLESIDLRDGMPGEAPDAALARLKEFIREKKVDAIVVGPFRSEVLLPAMDVIADRKIPFIGAIAMTPAMEAKVLKDPKYKYIFRTCLNSKYLVGYLIRNMIFLRNRFGFNKVFIMNQDVAWAKSTASLTMKLYFNRGNWDVLGQESYPSDASDFSSGLEKARARGAQVILCIFDAPQSGELVKQWNRMEAPALLAGFISPMVGPQAWETSGHKVAGVLSMVFELGNMPSSHYLPAGTFYEAFQEKYHRLIESGHGPAPAYESVYVLAEAITRAGTLDPEAIVTALEATDRVGAMGRIKFTRGHQVFFGVDPGIESIGCMIQWTRDGKRRIVFPRALAEGEIELPPFIKLSQ